MKPSAFILRCLISLALLVGAIGSPMLTVTASEKGNTLAKKKIFWVESYHVGYPWTDGNERGLRNALHGTGIRIEIAHMDSKRRNSVEEQKSVAASIARRIESFKPDLIIASDDPAQKFVVLPHLIDKGIPIVFTGVNWDATPYGYPRPGITGMVEVDNIETLVRHLRSLTPGKRFAFIASDDISEEKIIARHLAQKNLFPVEPLVAKVRSYEEYQKRFLEMQKEADAMILLNSTTLPGWDNAIAKTWIENNTRVVTGTSNEWMTDIALVSVFKVPEEQGEYAGKTALRILRGEKPEAIPLVTNEQSRLVLNNTLAKRLKIVFPLSLLRAASVSPRSP